MHKSAILAISLTVLLIMPFLGIALADDGVAVKNGDWIEYKVTVTGNPIPDLNITWARMDINYCVEGPAINVSVQTLFGNGTLYPEPHVPLNVATGAIGDGFFIPTNLKPGDIYQTEYEGNITISRIEHIEVARRNEPFSSASPTKPPTTGTNKKALWFQQSQTSQDASCTQEPAQHIFWQPQILGLNPSTFYSLIATFAVAFTAIVGLLFWHKRTVNRSAKLV